MSDLPDFEAVGDVFAALVFRRELQGSLAFPTGLPRRPVRLGLCTSSDKNRPPARIGE